jgi:hypothetical protein
MLKPIRGVFQRRCQCPLFFVTYSIYSYLIWLRTTDAIVENNGRKLSVTVLRLSTNLLLSSARFRLISMHYAHFCQGENESRQIQQIKSRASVKHNCANDNGEHDTCGLPLQRSEEKQSLLRSQPVLHLISSLESSISSTRVGSKRQTRHLLLPVTSKLLIPTTTLYNIDLPPATRNKCRYTHLTLLKKS